MEYGLMSKLTGNLIANTYKQLLQVGSNNTGLTSTEQTVQDGSGENSALKLSKSAVDINGTFKLNGVAITTNASAINAITDLTGITGLVAVSSGDVYGRTLTAGTGITIGNGDGTEGNPTIAVSLADTTINVAKVSASAATFNDTVSAGFFVGDGSGLVNVPSAEGGTVKFIEAGTGIKITVDGAVSSNIPVSGTILVSADQNFGTVSVSTAFVATGSAVFGTLSATNIDADELLMAGVSAANVTEVAAVSALTKTNLDSITSINSIIGDGSNFATSAELAAVSSALATSIATANTRITSVSDFAVALSATMATSIGTANTRITSVSDYAVALSATLAASIGTRLAIANNLSDLNNAETARTNLGVAIGSDVEAYDPDILKADTADELTAGFSAAAYNAGTQTTGTYTPDVDNGNFQYTINGGAHTLGVPSKNCTMVILYKNNASAGTVTTSGYTKVDGDTISTTDGDEFFFYITRVNDGTTTFSMLTVKALQ
jgi:hypothetical protein